MGHKRAKRSIREANRTKAGTDRVPNQHEEDKDLQKMPKNAMRILLSAQTREDYRKRKREEQEGTAPADGKGKKGKKATDTNRASTSGPSSSNPSSSSSAPPPPSKNGKSGLKIQPNESLLHFNRRVEDSLRSSVAIAAKSARTHSTDIERAEREERKAKHDERVRLQTERAKEKGKARAKEGGGMSEEDDGEDEDEDKEVKPPVMKKKKPSPSAAPATASKPKRETPTDFAPIQSSSAPRRLNDIAMAPPTLTLPRFASKAIKANAVGKPSGEGMADKLGLSLAQARILEEERERVILRYREIKERRGIKAEMGME